MAGIHSSIKKTLFLICIIYLAAAMIISPHSSIRAAKSALELCGNVVIPSLFPFIFCGNMCIALGAAGYARRYLSKIMYPLFGVSGAGAAALALGLISGYPVGAVCAAELYRTGECTKREAERLIAFCNNSGPMFIIGAVGTGIFGSHEIGVLLYLTHIFAALITGMIFKHIGRDGRRAELPPCRSDERIKNAAADMGAAVTKAVNTVLMICGFIIIFAVFTAALPQNKVTPYVYSVLEITGGLSELAKVINGEGLLVAAAAIIAFSGLSVLAQVASVAEREGLSVLPYIFGKCCQAAIAAALTYFAVRNVPNSINAVSIQGQIYPKLAYSLAGSKELFFASLSVIAVCAAVFGIVFAAAEIYSRMKK